MNSSMLAGERRWASARRGGMTVLGKVAVPKPINLPSQRLENHGLDPNVEIVPKGTASWGSRSSSFGSNPWASSSLSPNADGGTVSPSHLSGRPSSGGSGTRPSTSGSDRTHDLVPNAWGSNSRPSSASGTLSSNQSSSASLRPRSAENRPNSSQLSRFAEPVSKSTTTWGSSATAERLGVKSSKDDGFSLSSGDFPTLGSEKDSLVKNIDSQDHNRPNSASGRINQAKEDTGPHDDVKHGPVNTWRADGSQGAEDDIHPSIEKWQVDHHQYFNANNPPQRFDAWRGPPMNGPAGVWYGGRPPGPPFGAHVPPGGFPMEPFPYYRPQIPPPPMAGSQPAPPPGPRGAHPKNGDLYRPQMPDVYPRPGMPFRPGFYPGPHGPMPFEGYYGPPMSYCNNERDIPYMGMQAGPPVYNGYPPANADISNPHGRAAGRGPAGKTMQEQGEADQWEDAYGPKRVHIMSHNDCEPREGGGNREQNMQPTVPHPGKSHHPVSFRKNEWGAEEDTEEAVYSKRATPAENLSRSFENRAHSADSMKVKSLEGMGNVKGVNDNWMNNKTERGPSFPPVVSPLPVASERELLLPASNKNSALMNKIDGLNAKFRASDGWNDFPSAYKGEERNGSKIVDMKNTNNTGEVSNNTSGSLERTLVSRESVATPHEVIVPVGDNLTQPTAVVSRRPYYGGQSRVDQRGKGKFNGQDVDGWRRKPINTDSLGGVAASNNESAPNSHADAPNIVGETSSESLIVDPEGKIEGDSVETHDLTDIQAQRAKMRELAKQRALQRQKEEEERIKEQKAKAQAKLEELNRRTLAGEAANQKTEKTRVTGDTPAVQEESHNQKTEKTQVTSVQEESHTVVGHMIAELNVEEPGFNLVPGPAVAALDRGSNANQAVESVEVLKNVQLEMKPTGTLESNESPILVNEESRDNSTKKGASQANDGGYSRHKKPGYKQRQNNSSQRSVNDNSTHESHSSDARPSESNVLNSSTTVVEPQAQQRRKTNRSNKTKPKLDEASAAPALPPITSETNHGNELIDNGGPYNSLPNLESSASTLIEPETGVQAQEMFSPKSYEESQGRVSNQWKQNHSRRLPRSQPAPRSADKLHGSDTVVWAPVRPQNKAKGSEEALSQNSVQESGNSAKDGNNVGQNSLKGKRAEMERYVPKPVAKELAQPVNFPHLSSSICSSTSNEGSGWEQSGSVSSANPHFGPSVEMERYGIDNHNKHKKDHGTWKQRGSTDSSHVKGGYLEPIPTSEPRTDIQQSKELAQSARSEIAANADAKFCVKDQGATGRGKRHQQRGPRSTGKNPDSENNFSGEIDGISSIQSAVPDVNQTDRNIASKENRSIAERTSSHWQPKSFPHSANNHHGGRATGSESVTTEIYRNPKKDHPQHKQSGSAGQSEPGQSVNVKNNVAQESVVGHHRQEFDREKKPAPAKARPYSPRQDPVGSGESNTNTGDQLERNAPSGSRRNMRQNNRPIRSNDSRGDWSSGHENRPAFRERQRQNVHYEYQPVGPVKGNKSEEPADAAAENSDQRHRERGQSQSKRGGNFYRRQSGAVHVGSGRD